MTGVLFTGRSWDAATGLYYYRTRYMDPDLGRFISSDSIGVWGDSNSLGNGYAYVGNMGAWGMDPAGTCRWFDVPCKTERSIRETFDYVFSAACAIDIGIGAAAAIVPYIPDGAPPMHVGELICGLIGQYLSAFLISLVAVGAVALPSLSVPPLAIVLFVSVLAFVLLSSAIEPSGGE